MKELIKSIEPLVQEELARANEKFPQFASAHEGYAVLLEEVEEASDELMGLNLSLENIWISVKKNTIHESPADKLRIECIRDIAIKLAAESIQAAAMAQKFMDMLEREGK